MKRARCNACHTSGPRGKCGCGGRRGTSGPGGHRRSKFHDGQFIALDGEGVTSPDGAHDYTMLACSDGTHIVAPATSKLRTKKCLDYLLSVGKRHPGDIFVIFAGSYDVNMWLGDASEDSIATLWANRNETTNYTPILDGTYEVSFLPRKYFKVRRVCNRPRFLPSGRTVDGKPEYRRNVLSEITIWDVFGFYQSSFIAALEAYGCADSELVRDMKVRRRLFAREDDARVLAYCHQECSLLVELQDKLRDALMGANLTVSRWDGAGAVASALLKREKVKEHQEHCPPEVFDAARGAFAGGRIEQLRYGTYQGTIYQYDIVSAYPSAMPGLPSLRDATWVELPPGAERPPFCISLVQWDYADATLYPFHYRSDNGRISFPPAGTGWQWEPLIQTALKHHPKGTRIIKTLACYPATTDKPFAFLPDLFLERRKLKQSGNAAEKAIKLAINSLYGKQAQQVGYRKDKDTGAITQPPYFQLEWAGYITAVSRSRLYDAAMQEPDSIIALLTDAVLSLVPLDLPVGDALGQWEAHTWQGGVFAQSGVYWLQKPDGGWYSRFRGFDAGSLDAGRVAAALDAGQQSYTASLTRFVGMGQALRIGMGHWRRWETQERALKLSPHGTKRRLIGPDTGLRRTRPAYVPAADAGIISAPHKIVWIDGAAGMPQGWQERRDAEGESDATPTAMGDYVP